LPHPLTRKLEELLATVALRCDCPLCDVHGLIKVWTDLHFGGGRGSQWTELDERDPCDRWMAVPRGS
jgi:hypothetical protein